MEGTIEQLTEDNNSESVLFSLEDSMNLEFKSWLCICEHKYLKIINVTVFDKRIDHNLINEHDPFACLELINSGMLKLNMTSTG